MSGFLSNLHERHQQHSERREERHEARHARGHHNNDDDRSNYGQQHSGQRPYHGNDDDSRHPSYRSQGQDQGRDYAPPSGPPPSAYGQRSYQGNDDEDLRRPPYQSQSQGQGQGRGYAPPSGPPPSTYGQRPYQGNDDDDLRRPQSYQQQYQEHGRGYAPPSDSLPSARGSSGLMSQGGLDRGDFASDADIDRMIASGEFNEKRTQGRQEYGTGYGGAGSERRNGFDRYESDAPTGPSPGQGYGERTNEYGRYDAPSGPPPGRGYQSERSSGQGYGGNGGGSDRSNNYGAPQAQGRDQYGSSQGSLPGRGMGQGNAPTGGFSTSRDTEDKYGSGYGVPSNDRNEPSRRSEAASYYNQQSASGQDDRYANLARLAEEQGDDPELYRRATKGLDEKIKAQQSGSQRRNDNDDDYKAHVDAHQRAYGGNDNGPMDADAIGAAAAMEAIKQTANSSGSSKAPAGGFQAGKASGGPSTNTGRVTQEEEEAGTRGGASGGLQDKIMALAMSHAGKLFDKKNAGSSGDKSQDKAQAMQSAAANAMQLFGKYKAGKLDSSDMSSVMTLAMKMM